MKRFAEQLKKKSESVRMRAVERAELRERLVSYMEYHPLPKTEAEKNAEAYIQSEEFNVIRFSSLKVRMFMGAFAVLVLVIIPVVAERAVPGDVLYPVKVNFNEEVRSTLTVSPYAKVQWETKRLERRIAEARLLASEGRLTEEVEADVAAAVKYHSDAAQEGIAELRESDSEEAAIAEITFESALTVQSEVLEGTIEKEVAASGGTSTTPGHSVVKLADAVAAARQDASAKQSGVTPSYERLAARMESETTRAYELFESVKTVASDKEISDIERRLGDVERKIVDASALRDSEPEDSTDETATGTPAVLPEVALLRTALSDLQKLISFMTDIDVRENVTIEDLVPVTLTPEERTEALTTLLADIDARIANAAAALLEREPDTLTEKIQFGIDEAMSHATASHEALEAGTLENAEIAAEEALAYIDDVESLLGPIEEEDIEVAVQKEAATTTTSTTTDETGTTTGEVTEGIDGEVEGVSTTTEETTTDTAEATE